MESWYEVTLSDEDISDHKHLDLQNQFMALFVFNHSPKDAAMFDNADPVKGHHFYFSPGAVRFSLTLISRWGAQQVRASQRLADLCLLVGNSSARQDLFAGEGNRWTDHGSRQKSLNFPIRVYHILVIALYYFKQASHQPSARSC